MEKLLLAYGLPKETVTAIIMLHKNMKAIVCTPDGDSDFCDIVAGFLQGYTLVQYIFTLCLDYVLQTSRDLMKENRLSLKHQKRQKAEDIQPKPLQMQTTLMILCFWQIHMFKWDVLCIAWSRQQEALASM